MRDGRRLPERGRVAEYGGNEKGTHQVLSLAMRLKVLVSEADHVGELGWHGIRCHSSTVGFQLH